MARAGVLLTAFGGPGDLDQIAPFMRSLMGAEPSEDALRDARRRYLTIGGSSPLPAMAERIAVRLERALADLPPAEEPDEDAPGFLNAPARLPRATGDVRIPVAVGMLHSEPSIAHAVGVLADAGVRRIVSLSLSPFDAAVTTGAYRDAVAGEVGRHAGMSALDAADYRRSESFLTALSDAASEALYSDEMRPHRAIAAFTAHSLPVTDVERDPAYLEQLRETAAEVALRSDLGEADGFGALDGLQAFGGHSGSSPWLLAFQSKGRRGGEWIGPDLDEVIDAAVAQDFGAVVVLPIGFAIDHMETLYDLDVCAADRALSAGIEFARAKAPNDDDRMIEALADAVRRVL
jgi:protoporphyrin/coproporphyrin ferrochelatase